jgi:hypothetical protein
MFGGFDPQDRKHEFFARQRVPATILALLINAGLGAAMAYYGSLPPAPEKEEEVAVELAPEPKAEEPEEMDIEEEPEPEEAPPPPPNSKPQPNNKPAPKVETPTEVTDTELTESEKAASTQAGDGSGTGTSGQGTKTEPTKEPEKAPEPEPEPEKAPPKRDDSKPTSLTRTDKPAKFEEPRAMPAYPPAMQSRGIEGEVVVKIHVYRDKTIRKLTFTKVENNADTDELKTKANEAMKKLVTKAISSWKVAEPCKHSDGTAFVCTMTQKFPFKLEK